jgi:2-oxoglutarate dehydrogenase E2 component (dihydrolipoamide succinyltransferase)
VGSVVGSIETEADAGAETEEKKPEAKEEAAEEEAGKAEAAVGEKPKEAVAEERPAPAEEKPKEAPAPAAEEAEKPAAAAESPAGPAMRGTLKDDALAFLSPSTRRMVAGKRIDFSKIKGTGRDGRVTESDVIRYLEGGREPEEKPEAPKKAEEGKAPSGPAAQAPAEAGDEPVTRRRMTPIRRRIAERLLESKQNTAMLTTFNEIDMSRVNAVRKQFKEPFRDKYGVSLGFMSFFVSASVAALKEFPEVNAFIEGEEIVYHHYYHIGIAVSGEKGLVVPVVRHADRLSFAEIEKAIVDYAKKIKENRLEVSDMEGGTFTITNGGVFGSLLSTPILNYPQSGILGMHKIEDRPVAVDGKVEIRPMMYVALSYDHRIVDGREAVTFLRRIKEFIETPERMMIGI